MYNVFHPLDPVAYRLEPLFDPALQLVDAELVDHYSGMRTKYKLKQISTGIMKSVESINSILTTAANPRSWLPKVVFDGPAAISLSLLRKQEVTGASTAGDSVDSAIDLTATHEESISSSHTYAAGAVIAGTADKPLGYTRLNGGLRIDYMLQETLFESSNEYLGALTSHSSYFFNKDVIMYVS